MRRNLVLSILLLSIVLGQGMVLGQTLNISSNKRTLEDRAGKPFVWIGDTAWELFHVLDKVETNHYLTTRAEQGFTVIHAVLLAENNGLSSPNAYGYTPLLDNDPAKPNPKYFEHVDYVLEKAKSLGLFIALLPTWGNQVVNNRDGENPFVFNRKNAREYGYFLGNRYRDYPVVWVLGGDRNIDSDEAEAIWEEMAVGINEGNHQSQLMSYHPAGESTSAYWFHKSAWLDFNMYQTGHAKKAMPTYQYAESHLLLQPAKPFLDAEPAYEDIPVKFWEYTSTMESTSQLLSPVDEVGLIIDSSYFDAGYFTDDDIRNLAYWSVLSGALGFNYGNNAVWQMFSLDRKNVLPSLHTWKEALLRPAAQQMQHLRFVMEHWDFVSWIPDQSVIYGINRHGPTHMRAAVHNTGYFILIYTPIRQEIRINISCLDQQPYRATWFNTKTGELQDCIERTTTRSILTFFPPVGNKDWLLILERL